jgi:hypothetical protein
MRTLPTLLSPPTLLPAHARWPPANRRTRRARVTRTTDTTACPKAASRERSHASFRRGRARSGLSRRRYPRATERALSYAFAGEWCGPVAARSPDAGCGVGRGLVPSRGYSPLSRARADGSPRQVWMCERWAAPKRPIVLRARARHRHVRRRLLGGNGTISGGDRGSTLMLPRLARRGRGPPAHCRGQCRSLRQAIGARSRTRQPSARERDASRGHRVSCRCPRGGSGRRCVREERRSRSRRRHDGAEGCCFGCDGPASPRRSGGRRDRR